MAETHVGPIGGAEERLTGPAGEAPLQRDPRLDDSPPEVRDGVLPVGLASTAHHQQITRGRGEVVRRALHGGVGEAALAGTQEPRASGPKCEYADDRVVKPPHVGVAMKALTIAAIAVLDHREAGELHSVRPLDPSRDIRQDGMRKRTPTVPRRAEPFLLDNVVVAEQLRSPPGHGVSQMREQFVSVAQPVPRHVDP